MERRDAWLESAARVEGPLDSRLGVAGRERAGERVAGLPPPPPETTVALCGIVRDQRTGAPVAGLKLAFLSTRPVVVHATTDDEGRFQTRPELAPGIVSVMHESNPDVLRLRARWELEPPQFLLRRVEDGSPMQSLDLAARAPDEVLEVDVVMPEGEPAAGAAVTLTRGSRGRDGELRVEVRDLETTDLAGRARFAHFGGDPLDRVWLVEAEHEGAFVSDLLSIEGPFGARARRLDLFPAGMITIRARNEEGRPVANVSLSVACEDGGVVLRGRQVATDGAGEALVAPLRAACWTVTATHPLTGRSISRTLDLPRGASKEVEFVLGVGGLRLAASGSVVDELGYPLPGVTVRAQSGDEEPVELVTGDNGAFAFWARPARDVHVAIGGGFGDDIYDPASSTLPFGASGLAVVRRARLPARSMACVVFDAHSGKEVRRASIVLHHPGDHLARGGFAMQRHGAPSGVATLYWKERDDLRYAVEAPGYIGLEGRLADALEESGPWGPLRFDLARGFQRELACVDRATGRAVAGVQVRDGARLVGTSDGAGRVSLRADDWPELLRFDASGYAPLLWDPREAAFPGRVVALEPRRVVEDGR
ncbi:MAG: hypothetical protein RL112_689 [Planctomycetota bacterium]